MNQSYIIIFTALTFIVSHTVADQLFFRMNDSEDVKILSVSPPNRVTIWESSFPQSTASLEWSNDLIEWKKVNSKTFPSSSVPTIGEESIITYSCADGNYVPGQIIAHFKTELSYEDMKAFAIQYMGRNPFNSTYGGRIKVEVGNASEFLDELNGLEMIASATSNNSNWIDVQIHWGYSQQVVKTSIESIGGLKYSLALDFGYSSGPYGRFSVQILDEIEIVDALNSSEYVNSAQLNYIYN